MKFTKLILLLFFCNTALSQDVIFSENFDELKSVEKWTFNNKVEYAHFLGVDGSSYVRFHPVSIRVDLTSPSFAASAAEYRLYFDWSEASFDVPDSMTVYLSLNDGIAWKELITVGMGNGRVWQTDSVSLGIMGGDKIKLRFTRRGQRGFPAQYLNLDNIKVKKQAEVTSLKDNSLDISLSLYPNPSSGNLRLSINNPFQYNLNYRVYNALGQIVKNKNLSNSVYQDEAVDLSLLPKGNYYFTVSNEVKTATYSILIQ